MHGTADGERSDNELMLNISRGDADALAALYDRYASQALAVGIRVLRDRGQAEDVVQDAFLSAWRRASTFDGSRGSVGAWLMSITRNAAIDRQRGRFRHQAGEVDIEDVAWRLSTPDVWDAVAGSLDRDRVRAALTELPPEQRETLEMAYWGGMTQQEIATATSTPIGTVKSRARLGMRRLEKVFRADGLHTPVIDEVSRA